MPLYEYECEACGHRFEHIQKFSDPAIEVCPNCGERKVKKLVSSPAIQFKGSGWYITDYARKGADGKQEQKQDSKYSKDSKEAKDSKTSSESKESSTSSSTPTKTDSGGSSAPDTAKTATK